MNSMVIRQTYLPFTSKCVQIKIIFRWILKKQFKGVLSHFHLIEVRLSKQCLVSEPNFMKILS